MNKEKTYSTLPAIEKTAVMAHWLQEHKGRDLAAFKLPADNPLTEAVIIVTASSARHARSLADGLTEMCKQENFEILRAEGYQEGEWILVDLNDVIVHIFLQPARERYRLETLWKDASPLSETAKEEKEN